MRDRCCSHRLTVVDQIPPRPRAILSNDRLLGSFPGERAPAEYSAGEIVHDFSRMYLTETVIDRSTYIDATIPARGIPWVIVNGDLVVDEGTLTDARPGEPVRAPQR